MKESGFQPLVGGSDPLHSSDPLEWKGFEESVLSR